MLYRVESLLGQYPERLWPSPSRGAGWRGTFHHIGNRILRQYAKMLNFEANFTILDEEDSKSLIKQVVKEIGIDPSASLGAGSFGPDNVATRIHPITGWPWLLPPLPIPHPHGLALRLAFLAPGQERYGVSTFHVRTRVGWVSPVRRWHYICDGGRSSPHTWPHTLLVQAYQHLWLVLGDGAAAFTYVDHTTQPWLPLRLGPGRVEVPSRFPLLCLPKGCVVPVAPYPGLLQRTSR